MLEPLYIPTPPERRRLAEKTLIPERGVLKAYRDPKGRRESQLERLRRAAMELGLPAPGDPLEPRP